MLQVTLLLNSESENGTSLLGFTAWAVPSPRCELA